MVNEQKNFKQGMNTNQIKVIALVTMLMDHVGEFLFGAPLWLRYIGRISAPLFIFCLVWGMDYTSNRKKYILRLYIAGIVMDVTWSIVERIRGVASDFDNNFFVTLFTIAAFLYCFFPTKSEAVNRKSVKRRKCFFIVWQVLAIFIVQVGDVLFSSIPLRSFCAISGSLFFAEGGFTFFVLGILLYYFKEDKKKLAIGYLIFCIFYELNMAAEPFARLIYRISIFADETMITILNFFHFILFKQNYFEVPMSLHGFYWGDFQWMMIGALPIMLMYNRQRGKTNLCMKWFFYGFYPVHIAILYLIAS